MKLVELLAREMTEWPIGAGVAMQDPDRDNTIWCLPSDNGKIEFNGHEWKCPNQDFDVLVNNPNRLSVDYKTAIVTRAQWQAERDRQKGGEWKRHRAGRNQPVNAGVRVEVKLRCGDVQQGNAHEFIWLHSECDVAANIMQYRVISQLQAEELEVKDTTIGTLSYKVEIDTTEAAQAIDELAAKWDQVDGPLLWRDTVNELDAYIEEFTREREALINRLAEEGFALLPAMHPAMGLLMLI